MSQTTVKDELDEIQNRLHDQGAIWTRAELLRWYNDGYGALVADSGAVRRFYTFSVPPRFAAAGSFIWEERHGGGTFRKFMKSALGGNIECSYEWEVEFLEGATPTNSDPFVTQLWELEYAGGAIDDHYRFYLPKSHERILRVAWDDKRMFGSSDKEIDWTGSKWWQREGEPAFWLRGLDRDKTFEVYDIQTAYGQNYFLDGDGFGLARRLSGTRSYSASSSYRSNDYAYWTPADIGTFLQGVGWRFTKHDSVTDFDCMYQWEVDMLAGNTLTDSPTVFMYYWEAEILGSEIPTFPVGAPRAISSPDRQYLPMAYDTGELAQLGAARDFGSTKDAISLLETIISTRDLEEDDSPALIPVRMYKYLRFYVWALAFGRTGEGQRPALAKHYRERFNQGVALLKLLGDLTHRDRDYQRSDLPIEGIAPMRRPRLPATYPRIEY